jgi:hypothetical protein
MPLLYQQYIFRSDLQRNRSVTYVFGDNVERKGYGGQAKHMRGEPNAIGVVTKWKPTMEPDAFFSDTSFATAIEIMQVDLAQIHKRLQQKQIVIWPLDGIGTGLSMLPIKAPRIWAELEAARSHFETL